MFEIKDIKNKILQGNSLEVLKQIPDNSIDCCVTSPPYYGLRDYGTAKWEGGDENCNHLQVNDIRENVKQVTNKGTNQIGYKTICNMCGAIRIDYQIGLEETPEEYVLKMVEIFREVKRVLKDDGILWLNLGDTYSAHKDCKSVSDSLRVGGKSETANIIEKGKSNSRNSKMLKSIGLKNKDLIGIPWMVAFTLRTDGWYLRQDIIWHKPNPMPESVTDRCTKSHEYIFLMSKSQKYYYDNEAIKEPISNSSIARLMQDVENQKGSDRVPGKTKGNMKACRPNGVTRNRLLNYNSKENFFRPKEKIEGFKKESDIPLPDGKRNKRSVWTVNTHSYSEAHFATFPEELISPCIKAGCPKFICKKCGKAREPIRVAEKIPEFCKTYLDGEKNDKKQCGSLIGWVTNSKYEEWRKNNPVIYELSDCGCNAGWESGIVIDPFMGAGTTGLVSLKEDCNYVGIELNPEYIKIAEERIYEYRAGKPKKFF